MTPHPSLGSVCRSKSLNQAQVPSNLTPTNMHCLLFFPILFFVIFFILLPVHTRMEPHQGRDFCGVLRLFPTPRTVPDTQWAFSKHLWTNKLSSPVYNPIYLVVYLVMARARVCWMHRCALVWLPCPSPLQHPQTMAFG